MFPSVVVIIPVDTIEVVEIDESTTILENVGVPTTDNVPEIVTSSKSPSISPVKFLLIILMVSFK